MAGKTTEKPDMGMYIAIGLCLGTGMGVALGNIAIGTSLGLLFGIVLFTLSNKGQDSQS